MQGSAVEGETAHLLVREEELEIFELSARVRDLVCVAVQSFAALVLTPGLVVGEHAQTVLHRENLVVHAPVVSVLVSQVVESLTQLCDQLVFLGRSYFYS